jgi:uncharacterized repeat protein (TIGR01451 family)
MTRKNTRFGILAILAVLTVLLIPAAPAGAAAEPDPAVSTVDTPDPVKVGSNITYVITVKNNGSAQATNVSLTDNSGGGFVSVGNSEGSSCSNVPAVGNPVSGVSCPLGNLDVGSSKTMTVVVSTSSTGTITNSAGASMDQVDPTFGDLQWNENTAVVPVNDFFADATVLIGPSGTTNGDSHAATQESGETPAGGAGSRSVWYSWTAPSDGTFWFDTCVIDSSFDSILAAYTGTAVNALTEVAYNNQGCGLFGNNGSLLVLNATNGTTYPISVNGGFDIHSNTTGGTFTLAWYPEPTADLSVTKSDSDDPVTPGSSFTYTLKVKNNGPDEAKNVVVTDPLPVGIPPDVITTSQGSCHEEEDEDAGIITVICQLGDLDDGEEATITIEVLTFSPELLSNTASVSSDTLDRINTNDSDTEATTVGVASASNLLKNGSFEKDANGNKRPDKWTSDGEFTRRSAVVFAGHFAGRHFDNGNESYAIKQTVQKLEGGATYDFSGMVNIPPTNDKFAFKIDVVWQNAAGVILGRSTAKTYTGPTGGWIAFSKSLVAPDGTAKAQVRMVVSSLKGTIYVDDFVFKAVSGGT